MRTARASSRPAPVFHGRITPEGAFELVEDERAKRRDYFTTLAGCDVDIRVTKHKDTRSERANAYYWACVLTPMSDDGSAGDQSPEDIHDAMCEKFLPKEHKRVEFFNRMTGEVLTVESDARRSSKQKGDAFYDFVEQVRKFALEFMGVVTADPDPEYWRKRASKVAA